MIYVMILVSAGLLTWGIQDEKLVTGEIENTPGIEDIKEEVEVSVETLERMNRQPAGWSQ